MERGNHTADEARREAVCDGNPDAPDPAPPERAGHGTALPVGGGGNAAAAEPAGGPANGAAATATCADHGAGAKQPPAEIEKLMFDQYEIFWSPGQSPERASEEARQQWQKGFFDISDEWTILAGTGYSAEEKRLRAAGASEEEVAGVRRDWVRRAVKSYAWPSVERLEAIRRVAELGNAHQIVRYFRGQTYLTAQEESAVRAAKELIAREELKEGLAADVFAAPEQTMLADGLLAQGQLAVLGGGDKGQKSNFMFDLALSLASGTPVVGHFAVPQPLKVLVFSAETRGAARARICGRIARSKGLTQRQMGLVRGNLIVNERVPEIGSEAGLVALEATLEGLRAEGWEPELVCIDPAYMALGGDIDMARINHVGAAVLAADEVVRALGATLLLAWHYSKQAQFRLAAEREPAQLGDLTGAGASSAARQWLLLSYSRPYDRDTGHSTVWLNAGIATAQSQLYLLEVDEGQFVPSHPDGLDGRKWDVTVRSGAKAFEAVARARQEARAEKQLTAADELRKKVIDCLAAREPHGALSEEIRDAVGSKNKVGATLKELVRAGEIVRSRQPGDAANAKRYRKPARIAATEEQLARLQAGEPVEEVVEELD
jgi:hypothetical protein